MRHRAAPTWRILRVLAAAVAVLSLCPFASRADESSSSRRDSAEAQFDRAEKARADLEAQPEASRTLKQYTALVIEYQRVYLITSHAADVPAALNHVAELFRTMGDLFDAKYYQRSIDEFDFLNKEYPANKYREDALLSIAHIQQDDLHDPAQAQKTYEEFLSLHPHSSRVAEVRAALDKLTAHPDASKPGQLSAAPVAKDRPSPMVPRPVAAGADKTPPTTDTKQGASDDSSADTSSPRVSRIRTWNADTYTRIVIDVGAKVKYQAARISGPDRIYFDIEGAKLNSSLLHKPIEAESGYLKNIRIAQNQSGVVRVVLEVNRVSDYSVFLLPDPYRLVVDVYGNSAAAEAAARNIAPPPGPTTGDPAPPGKTDKPAKDAATKAELASKAPDKASEKPPDKAPEKAASKTSPAVAQDSSDTKTKPQSSAAAAASDADDTDDDQPAARKTASGPTKNPPKAAGATSASAKAKKTPASQSDTSDTLSADASTVDGAPLPLTSNASIKKSLRSSKSAHDQAEEMGPAPTPELTRDGQHSLTRALGLKIGRIVIDAGHGGHDTGTIGPSGLMEKDLCLDVALRLGKIIQQRLPSAEVVYTRDDDTFIPLERRTEIANEAKADLFISIHANSSQDHQARGIETYYLNFTGSSDAMEVAARENALSENAVHDLQDIVAKIARNEKIEESRDLATMVQDSLSKRMETVNRGERNRGVRKAPFVVLIGADMPSVLAEISFLSNPSDEKWLKTPENRQRVADGLYRGIESYLQSTNSLTANQVRSSTENLSGKVARSGNPQ